ncbi:imelysin family protein [Ruegeria sp. HKCCD8929]|uniref:imelysin family protein n=1 Tax=Ruegeria sp. HKCCD8929 TaxID=2683006 RepID=UPI001488B411|nr:imelysin family protein [Ruegeria sp. HKCCD8929]
MRLIACLLALLIPATLFAQDRAATLTAITDAHILPSFAELTVRTEALKTATQKDCMPASPDLQTAFHAAFDAWIAVSHLRFGPTEEQDRAFALAFWPDTKGFTPKTLSALIAAEDPAVNDPDAFASVSIAGRGFFALEAMLYDAKFAEQGSAPYRCALIRAIAADIDANADAIRADWQQDYTAKLTAPGPNSPYRSGDEAVQELFKALATGLQFTADTRLGRPMGTFDRPRPNRAEARRSGRALRHVVLSLTALRDLAALLAADHPDVAAELDAGFAHALDRAEKLNDPTFAGVADPQGRFRVETLQQAINDIRDLTATRLGPTLDVAAGFNSLDGD